MHLIIDGYGGDFQKIQDVELIYEILSDYPSQIGMVRVSLPQVSKYVEPELGNEGVSGFVLLEESHISIHVFPSQSYVNIDVFSCGDFDFEKAAKGFQEKLGLTKIKSYVLNRASEMSVKPHISEKLKDSKKWALIS